MGLVCESFKSHYAHTAKANGVIQNPERNYGLATLFRFCSDTGTIFRILFSELILICFYFSVDF